jgi:GrpB-like predicted nucleotidyltransferase (UPF0157 family)
VSSSTSTRSNPWPERFALEEQRIRRAAGDSVLRLEHVDSTSLRD